MKINKQSNLTTVENNPENLSSYVRSLDNDVRSITTVLQSNVSFGSNNGLGENIAGQWVSFLNSGGAKSEFQLNHSLGSIPQGYFVASIKTNDLSGSFLYDGASAHTTTLVYLRASQPCSGTIFVIK